MSLKCCACCSIKPLADFSGNQKKKVDEPRCLRCIRSKKPVVTSLNIGTAGSSRRCTSCNARKDPLDFDSPSTNECQDCSKEREIRLQINTFYLSYESSKNGAIPGRSCRAGRDFIRKYNSRNFKANRKKAIVDGGIDNFRTTRTGDLKPATYLTHHAKQRIAQRGVSYADAIRGKRKTGVIEAPDGAIITVVPHAWLDQQKAKEKRRTV